MEIENWLDLYGLIGTQEQAISVSYANNMSSKVKFINSRTCEILHLISVRSRVRKLLSSVYYLKLICAVWGMLGNLGNFAVFDGIRTYRECRAVSFWQVQLYPSADRDTAT